MEAPDHCVDPRRHWRLRIIELCQSDLAIGVDDGLLIDAPDAFERAYVESILSPTVPGAFNFEFAVRFFVGRGLLQRDDLGFGEHQSFLGYLCLQCL